MRLSARYHLTHNLLLFLTHLCSVPLIKAEDCKIPPESNAPTENVADDAFKNVLTLSAGCMKETDSGCANSKKALDTLQVQALLASGTTAQCAATGTNAGTALSAADKASYLKRSAFWLALYQSMQKESDAIKKGTYKLSDDNRTAYLGVALQPKPPVITSKVVDGASSLTVQVDVTNFSANNPSRISVCGWAQKPTGTNAMDCTDPNSQLKAVALIGDNVGIDGNKNNFIPAKTDGSYTLSLKTALQISQYISITQRATVGGKEIQITSATASPVTLSKQCNPDVSKTPFSDCDLSFSIIGGVEQSAQSSLPSATTPFLRVFTRAGKEGSHWQAWGTIRLLGAPQASSTNGVVSAVTDPAGNISTQTFSGIGTSVDFMVGGELDLTRHLGADRYAVSLIAGYGGTTPLTANTLNQAYKAPAFGTVECATLQSRFAQQFRTDNILVGTSTNATTPSCLVNGNSITSASGATTVTYTPINTIGFSNQDRSSFLGKALFGIRTIDHFPGTGNQYCGDADSANQIGPCERGIVDFVFGQDATVTGGQMRHFVFKVDGVHPLPVKSVSFLYIFGTATIRLTRNTNLAPLVLQSGDVASLSGNGASAVPNTGVVVLPLTQPNRDFYRFGVGVNINTVFKKLFSSPAPTS